MDTRYDFGPETGDRIVYVRPVAVADLPEELREQAMGLETIYAVHDASGDLLPHPRDARRLQVEPQAMLRAWAAVEPADRAELASARARFRGPRGEAARPHPFRNLAFPGARRRHRVRTRRR